MSFAKLHSHRMISITMVAAMYMRRRVSVGCMCVCNDIYLHVHVIGVRLASPLAFKMGITLSPGYVTAGSSPAGNKGSG